MTDRWTCPGCRDSIALTRTQRLRAHPDPRTDQPCPGKGFCINEPEYPQLVKLWGWQAGIKIMKQQAPEWVPPTESGPHPLGTLQQIILKAYPAADAFGYAGALTGDDSGITFCVSRWWYFAASDGHVGEKYPARANAADALHRYMEEN
ncbi:hypothetical protein ABT282_08835 [Streptomyces sp. NPDC000927]|uniref:hypothetical protein n=1 Tax=Streptomyces sp. NPDC000927 TaxID=3154371 RepID=UPI00331BA01D